MPKLHLNPMYFFIRGALFPDGRMDLCKQVVGPNSIVELCQAVSQSGAFKHFLLGNNIVFDNDTGVASQAMAPRLWQKIIQLKLGSVAR